ncbi:hypothetical protein SVAN01_03964 [Stagonosporopsis vannaccii]|nr:hypothetical protein SVAN01_03964 [Stagonosporopsis vannaccii]
MALSQQRQRLTEKDWKLHETVIRSLFLKDGLPLNKVKDFMKEKHQVTATDRQWKHRIKRWKLDRNVKDHEMRAMIRKSQFRRVSEPRRPQLNFRVRGFNVDHKKLLRWMKEHDVAGDQLYTDGSGARTPSDISCYTHSRQGSPSAAYDVEMNEAVSARQRSPIPEVASNHLTDTSISEPSSRADERSAVSESQSPRCWAKTTDVSWAFDTPWKELSQDFESGPEGSLLAVLVEALTEEASKKGLPSSIGTLATMLRGDLTNSKHILHHDCQLLRGGISQELTWLVRIERTIIDKSTLLVRAYVANLSPDNLMFWLDLRLRIGLGSRYYREGLARSHTKHGPSTSEALFEAISQNDIDEVARLLSAGEATVFSLDDWDNFPVHASAFEGNIEITRLLLERGSPVNNVYGESENIIWAIWEGFSSRWVADVDDWEQSSFEDDFARCKDLMTLAVDYGAQIDECVDPTRYRGNILFRINRADSLDRHQFEQVLQYLIGLGVDVEHRDVGELTPLLHAIQLYTPNPAAISAYLHAKADVSATDDAGRGCLHLAIERLLKDLSEDLSNHKEVLLIILRADARYKERAITFRETPLVAELAYNRRARGIWRAVFEELRWDFPEMEFSALELSAPQFFIPGVEAV